MRPKFIVADEPVSSLDVSIQAQVINLLEELQAEYDLTYLFIAHDLSVIYHISDRVAVMYLGHIVEEGATDDLFATPRHPYTQALLAAVPVVEKSARRTRILLQGGVPSPIDPPSGCPFHPRCFAKKGPICESKRRLFSRWAPSASRAGSTTISRHRLPTANGDAERNDYLEAVSCRHAHTMGRQHGSQIEHLRVPVCR